MITGADIKALEAVIGDCKHLIDCLNSHQPEAAYLDILTELNRALHRASTRAALLHEAVIKDGR